MRRKLCDMDFVNQVIKDHPDWVFTCTPEAEEMGEGTLAYRLVNLKKRKIIWEEKWMLGVGDLGGYVEHPDLLDFTQDFWMPASGVFAGNVTVEGPVRAMYCRVQDSTLKGSVQIGQPKDDHKKMLEDIVYNNKRSVRVTVQDSVLDAEDGTISLMDMAKVVHCNLYGDTSLTDTSRATDSTLRDCFLCDYAWVHHSVLADTQMSESATVLRSKVLNTRMKGNAAIEGSLVRGMKLDGNRFIQNGVRTSHFLSSLVSAS